MGTYMFQGLYRSDSGTTKLINDPCHKIFLAITASIRMGI
jgi:hypothetical protein